jgi:hypothetical protein
MDTDAIYLGIDIGAGHGAKLALFPERGEPFAHQTLPVSTYGGTFEHFADALAQAAEDLFDESERDRGGLRGIGVACAGIFGSEGQFLLAQNLPFCLGQNLPAALEDRLGAPAAIENDANAGGLAEWSVLKVELLYWVLGGGWGGAWIDGDGAVRYSSEDWDGEDASLHLTNEPGYAIPLEKIGLKTVFHEVGASYERFERVLVEDFGSEDALLGPGGSPDHLRAEVILSGPGRCRLFRAVVGDDDFYERFLDIHETRQMTDPVVAGALISKLSSMRVEAAINTDRLFGKILAGATRTMLKTAVRDGMPESVPICLGGKPSYALPYFGPSAQRALGRMGIMNYLRPSVIDERGSNANLVGAAVLARNVARGAARSA